VTAVARKLCVTFHGFYLDEHRVQGDAPKQQFADFRRANRLAPYAGEPGHSGAGSGGGSDDRSDRVPHVWHRAARGCAIL